MKKILVPLLSISCLIHANTMQAQTPAQRTEILLRSNLTKLQTLQIKLKNKSDKELAKARVILAAKQKPEIFQNPDGSWSMLHGLTADGKPAFYQTSNTVAAAMTRTNHLQTGGSLGLDLSGENMSVFIWDAPNTLVTHTEFLGGTGQSRIVQNDDLLQGVSFLHHCTHVAGTLIASGLDPTAQGMAPEANAYAYSLINDLPEITQALIDYGMLISNHSYTPGATSSPMWLYGAYDIEAKELDELMNASPYYLMVAAASNYGNVNYTSGYPFQQYGDILGFLNNKNGLVVASVNDLVPAADGTVDPADITRYPSSSLGPTDELRIKPDIAGNGDHLYSTTNTSNSSYVQEVGTSMASPNVAGSLLLLQQHASNVRSFFLRAASVKGLVLHTATPNGTLGTKGPDAELGWGLLNAKAAAEVITDNGAHTILDELSLNNGETITVYVQANGIDALQASISWNDPAGAANPGIEDDTTPVLVNDLDIRLTRVIDSQVTLPWKLALSAPEVISVRGDNFVDPYERVDITDHLGTANATALYEITITHKGSLASAQEFALIVTGAERVASENVSIKVNDGGVYGPMLDIPVSCGTVPFTIQYEISDDLCSNIFALQSTQIGLKISGPWNESISIVAGDGIHSFDAFGKLQFPASELAGSDVIVSAQFQVDGMITNTLASYIDIEIDTDVSTDLGICADAEVTLSHPMTCLGDIDTDGAITSSDLSLFLAVFGSTVGPCSMADFDGNLDITTADLTGFLSVFGTICGNGNTPEGTVADVLSDSEQALIRALLNGDTDLEIKLYPNPSSAAVRIEYSALLRAASPVLDLLDISGRVLEHRTLDGSGALSLDISNYASGTYLIRISSSLGTDARILIRD